MKYAGSIDYDDHNGDWADDIILGDDYKEFIQDMKDRMKIRKNSSVFFAAKYTKYGTEKDITGQVKADCG